MTLKQSRVFIELLFLIIIRRNIHFLKTLTYISMSVKWSLEAGSKIESVPKKLFKNV